LSAAPTNPPLPGPRLQWLASWTLIAFVATLVFVIVLGAMTKPLIDKTPYKLQHLQLSGLHPRLAFVLDDHASTATIVAKWREAGVLDQARRAQAVDFVFPLAYGAFALLMAAGLRRLHPGYPDGGRWIWGVGAGAAAAVFDEVENVCLWSILQQPGYSGGALAVVAAVAAAIKFLLLAVVLLTFVVTLARARA
jgi:hypothetical protein